MTRAAALSMLAALSLGACAPDKPGNDKTGHDNTAMAREAEARSEILADRFQKELLTALTAAMEAEGPEGAIGVCASIAPALAVQLSEESGASVRRTALRTRNLAAKADATEQRVMEGWSSAPLDKNRSPKRWVAHEGGEYRYMRAIPTMPMCLACHGQNIAPEVTAEIRKHYPEDQATGFAQGQLRGAFSIRWDEAALSRAMSNGEGRQ